MNEGGRSEEAPFLSSLVLFRTFPVALFPILLQSFLLPFGGGKRYKIICRRNEGKKQEKTTGEKQWIPVVHFHVQLQFYESPFFCPFYS